METLFSKDRSISEADRTNADGGQDHRKGFLMRFKVYDLAIIAMMASLGIAVKPLVVALAHLITGPLFIPGGSLAGGFYMMWLVLGAALVKRPGTAALIGLVQAIMVIAAGVYGSHGIFSIVTYTLPGLAVDAVFLGARSHPDEKLTMFFSGISANLTGVILSNIIFFRLPALPLMLSVCIGAFSGAVGGLLAHYIAMRIEKLRI
ncbi:hypothetical protein MASR2M70_09380 [Bacillota bacterium]